MMKKELENYLDKENYRENEQKEIDKIIDDAKEKIDNATTIEEINKIKEDTKHFILNTKKINGFICNRRRTSA